MSSPLSDVVEGYTRLGSWLVERWAAQASKVAGKLDAGTYDAKSAADDMASTASLAAETGFLLVSEAFDAVAVLTGRQGLPHIVYSDWFDSSLPGATLSVAGALTDVLHSDALHPSVVAVEPSSLGPGETQFRLRADASGHRAGTYLGSVLASTPGAAAEPVEVWITVPRSTDDRGRPVGRARAQRSGRRDSPAHDDVLRRRRLDRAFDAARA